MIFRIEFARCKLLVQRRYKLVDINDGIVLQHKLADRYETVARTFCYYVE